MADWQVIGKTQDGEDIVGRIDEDGLMRVTGLTSNPEYVAWLEAQTPKTTSK